MALILMSEANSDASTLYLCAHKGLQARDILFQLWAVRRASFQALFFDKTKLGLSEPDAHPTAGIQTYSRRPPETKSILEGGYSEQSGRQEGKPGFPL